MTITKINSKINGTMLKNKKRNKNSVPIIPLSTINPFLIIIILSAISAITDKS